MRIASALISSISLSAGFCDIIAKLYSFQRVMAVLTAFAKTRFMMIFAKIYTWVSYGSVQKKYMIAY